MAQKKWNRTLAVLTVTMAALAAWSGLALGIGPGQQGIARTEESNVEMKDPIRIKEKAGSQVIVSHITVAPGGHTLWHYHPGPHIVSVDKGEVEVYETDCTFTKYETNTGFFDPGPTLHPHIHTLRNPSPTESAEVVITDIRVGDPRPAIPADPQPAPCFE
jgi:hypothetical protein